MFGSRPGPAVVPGRLANSAKGILAEGQRVVNAEVVALSRVQLGDTFVEAVRLIADRTEGVVVTTGVGKSGLVAQRIAATLTVTGTPAHYLHAGDAGHGDVGKLTASDTLLMVSRSGEGGDLLSVAYYAGNKDTPIILITGTPASALASEANIGLEHGAEEAWQHGLTPTSTVTCASVIGDALALALQQYRGFGAVDFAALHSSGNLGRRLTTYVKTVMVTGDAVGRVTEKASMASVMVVLAEKRGTVVVLCTPRGELEQFVGVVTAGDVVRRLKISTHKFFEDTPAESIMATLPFITTPDTLLVEAVEVMQNQGVMALPVVEDTLAVPPPVSSISPKKSCP